MLMTTASDAPASIPRIPGSANGLRVTPCITAPDRPSATPTSTPSTVRGTRRLRTMRWSFRLASWCQTASHTVPRAIGFDP